MPIASRARLAALLVLFATVVQLVVAAFVPGLPQFESKGFGARLVLYPLMMLIVPALWWWRARSRASPPWAGFALVMAPFLVDVTGNTLDLYDSVAWFDDACHLLNWFLLTAGLGVVLRVERITPAWARLVAMVGGGALLAIVWEVGEWFAFIRFGTERATAYEDTLGDQVLGTLGSLLAALTIFRLRPAPTAGELPPAHPGPGGVRSAA